MSAAGLPPNLLALFQPRTALEFMPPIKKKPAPRLSSCAEYVTQFTGEPGPPVLPFETPKERTARKKVERIAKHHEDLQKSIDEYKPNSDAKCTDDPFSTLFLSRINYGTTEKKLKKEFEAYGSVKHVRLVKDLEGKARGYGFLEFETDKDMKEAYKRSDGVKIDGRRLLVDVERGRVVSGWLPRRLGGGRGAPRFIPPKGPKGSQPNAGGPSGAMQQDERREERPRQDFAGRQDRRPDRRERGDRDFRDKGDRGGERDRDRHRERRRSRSRSRERSRDRRQRSPRDRRRDRDRDRERDAHRYVKSEK